MSGFFRIFGRDSAAPATLLPFTFFCCNSRTLWKMSSQSLTNRWNWGLRGPIFKCLNLLTCDLWASLPPLPPLCQSVALQRCSNLSNIPILVHRTAHNQRQRHAFQYSNHFEFHYEMCLPMDFSPCNCSATISRLWICPMLNCIHMRPTDQPYIPNRSCYEHILSTEKKIVSTILELFTHPRTYPKFSGKFFAFQV